MHTGFPSTRPFYQLSRTSSMRPERVFPPHFREKMSLASMQRSPNLTPNEGAGRHQRLGPLQKDQIPLGTSWWTPRRCATRPGAFGGGGRLGPAQPATSSNSCEAPQALRSQPRLSQRDLMFLRRSQPLVAPLPTPKLIKRGGGETRPCRAGKSGDDYGLCAR